MLRSPDNDHRHETICNDHCNTSRPRGTHNGTRGRKTSHHNNRSVTPKRRYSREPTAIGEQIKSASHGSLIGGASSGIGAGRGVRIPHQGSVWQRYRHELSAVVSVPKRMNYGLNFHARRKGLRNPALPRPNARAPPLDPPLLSLTLVIVD